MADKAYIVANEQQEKILLAKLEQQGCSWNDTENTPPTEWHLGRYPYAIFVKYGKKLVWGLNVDISEVEIVAEDKQDKFKISKEVYDALVEWRDAHNLGHAHIDGGDLLRLPTFILNFWLELGISQNEANNRLIAIIRWVNGEDVFEVEKPKKWVVRSKEPQGSVDGKPIYGWFVDEYTVELEATMPPYVDRFNTREEAESWANAHQEVVEIEVEK